eukprot:6214681-Pleurochrysis_carterae.AAC.12
MACSLRFYVWCGQWLSVHLSGRAISQPSNGEASWAATPLLLARSAIGCCEVSRCDIEGTRALQQY